MINSYCSCTYGTCQPSKFGSISPVESVIQRKKRRKRSCASVTISNPLFHILISTQWFLLLFSLNYEICVSHSWTRLSQSLTNFRLFNVTLGKHSFNCFWYHNVCKPRAARQYFRKDRSSVLDFKELYECSWCIWDGSAQAQVLFLCRFRQL